MARINPGFTLGEGVGRLPGKIPSYAAHAGTQYAAAYQFNHWLLWDTGSLGPGLAKALLVLARRSSSDGGKPGDDN